MIIALLQIRVIAGELVYLSPVLNMSRELIWSNLDSQNIEMRDESFGFAPSTLVFKGSDAVLAQSKY